MPVNRSGYYKWLHRKGSGQQDNRRSLMGIISEVHVAHPSHGYRWVCAFIRLNYHMEVSENYVYRCYQCLGLQAQTKHKRHYKPCKEKDRFPNLIYSTWDTVDHPLQVIVSDMVAFKIKNFLVEVTFYIDVFSKKILSFTVADYRGDRMQYISGLKSVVGQVQACTLPLILHTDQGSVYSSKAYNEIIKDTIIVRSMSRRGKPTDNPVNEALNGWIKEELMTDFGLRRCTSIQSVKEVMNEYVHYYNTQRPCYAINYYTPQQFEQRYYNGLTEKKDTFEKRHLSTIPKFVQKRKQNKQNQANTKECGNE